MNSGWAVILAGGNGTRLKEFSRLLSGDDRPKQFCSLFGAGSLLSGTRTRLKSSIPPERTIFVVVKEHERFYQRELADVDPWRVLVQPANRGTTAAIVYSLVRLQRFEKDPIVAFCPADHHFVDEKQFERTLKFAIEAVREHRDTLVLLGAQAERAEVEYGWIEPGARLNCRHGDLWDVFRVERFYEKPSIATAESLLRRGCLWNTFVIAGRASAFLKVIGSVSPGYPGLFRAVAAERQPGQEAKCVEELYAGLPNADFSREVLSTCVERLAVVRLENAGWGDLGTPEGVFTAMHNTVAQARAASASGALERAPSRADADAPAGNAFEEWFARYRHHLELMCRRSQASAARQPAERNLRLFSNRAQ